MKPFAILTTHPHYALEALHAETQVARYNRTTCRGELRTGQPFIIVTEERQLEGVELSGFRLLGPGFVDQRLIDRASARVR